MTIEFRSIHSSKAFRKVMDHGNKSVFKSFVTFFLFDDVHGRALPTSQGRPVMCFFGVIASRKIGGAVVRNRCKRRLRAAFRTCMDAIMQNIDMTSTSFRAFDIVMLSRHFLLKENFSVLCNNLLGALKYNLRPVLRSKM